MKKLICFLLVIISVLTIHSNNVFAQEYNSSSEIVMEVNTNRVLYQSNAYQKKYMASTTKILTAITIIENCDLNDEITITKESVGIEGSSIYLKEGETYTIEELLYGLMLCSGNDCAHALATYCSGSIKDFAILMNNTAQKIGAMSSSFINPHGLHDDNHFTTAYDLALISCYSMKNINFRKIVGSKHYIAPKNSTREQKLFVNKNKMLKEFNGSTGIKTGFTKKAGRCLVSSCVKDGMELVCVVLNCPPMFERSKHLLTSSFNEYSMCKVLESDDIIDFVSIENFDKKVGVYIKDDIIIPVKKGEKDKIKIEYDYPKKLKKPIKKDAILGFVKIYIENNLIFEQKAYTIVDIK